MIQTLAAHEECARSGISSISNCTGIVEHVYERFTKLDQYFLAWRVQTIYRLAWPRARRRSDLQQRLGGYHQKSQKHNVGQSR